MKLKCLWQQLLNDITSLLRIDGCDFEVIEERNNVSIQVLKCKDCGKISIGWFDEPKYFEKEYSKDTEE